ncbi:septal ring lytic transglycosylase RlpA family protein [Pseudoduganella violacea]|uniref:Endolytic peptidoglycan transglycosylase RlpA n=1 Tax=Pseudoduganella violacea TaxID=1715466 RepID=A0A7W5FTX7_9BURK|nr:septal ring lytic transglycosylase RlpA family protein [Pseudoduganella violacea]MBB3119061.1 rare lipoprotein A [Pseudoduganella violacea]
MMQNTLQRCAAGALALALLALAGCTSVPLNPPAKPAPTPPAAKPRAQEPGVPVLPPANSGRGGYYKDDGPGENPPPNLLQTPDAEPREEPPLPRANRPYVVLGKTYTPISGDKPFVQRGLGTWYGKKFHGQRTSSGELYDMYKMTAAHPTLPIPSYAKVTNLDNGNVVVVRINDRGPFHSTRIIDVSYTAALKLGLLAKGSHQLEVVRLLPSDMAAMADARKKSGDNGARLTALPSEQSASVQTASVQAAQAAAQPPAWQQGGQTPRAMPKAAPMLAVSRSSSDAAPAAQASPLGAAGTDTGGIQAASDNVQAAGEAAPASAAAGQGNFYLQLGAYSRQENAEAARTQLMSAGSGPDYEIVQVGSIYRLYGGPFASRQDAAQAAQRLPTTLKLKPLIIQR